MARRRHESSLSGRGPRLGRSLRLASRRGYSLLEILIVLAIMALIATVVGPRLFAQFDRSKVTTARVQVRSLETALETMRLDIGRYPTQDEGLALLVQADPAKVAGWYGPYLAAGAPKDPWGHAYVYEASPDAQHAPKVCSYGADGKPGGAGNAADIYGQGGG